MHYIRSEMMSKSSDKSTCRIFNLKKVLIAKILTQDFETFKAAIRAPGIGKLTMLKQVQDAAKKKFKKIVFDECGNVRHYVNDTLHSVGMAAVYRKNGAVEWYCNGKLHREGGPAVITGDMKLWYINGVLQREEHNLGFINMRDILN
jgi:hypothetical protein